MATDEHGVLSREHFQAVLEYEVQRARAFAGRLAVMMVNGEWSPKLRAALRPVDQVALYGPQTVEVLLPEASEEAALATARKVAEIGELAPDAQVALLRVLETGKLTRVGGTREISVDVRIVAATHRELEAMVGDGSFREDLLYRLNAMVVRLPPLRERTEEIEPLAVHFLELANRSSERKLAGFDAAALRALQRHSWPGNVRELRNAVERAVVIAAARPSPSTIFPSGSGRWGGPEAAASRRRRTRRRPRACSIPTPTSRPACSASRPR